MVAVAVRLVGTAGRVTTLVFISSSQLKPPTVPRLPLLSTIREVQHAPGGERNFETVTVFQTRAPPVLGTVMEPETFCPSTSRLNVPPVACAVATRKEMLYVPPTVRFAA